MGRHVVFPREPPGLRIGGGYVCNASAAVLVAAMRPLLKLGSRQKSVLSCRRQQPRAAERGERKEEIEMVTCCAVKVRSFAIALFLVFDP